MKIPLLLALAGLAIGSAVAALAQDGNTVDPQVRQEIEAALIKFEEAFNDHDATAIAALFTLDAAEVVGSEMADAGSLASGREAIEKRYASHFASSPSKSSLKLVQVYAIGSEVCAISERSHGFRFGKGYLATIYVREADDWKIRMAYSN